jgi:glycosyltransferase involved in cell wall biosynthesis
MNILYISSKKRWGGVVSWMVKTARGLRAKGHKVFVLSHPDSKLNKTIPDEEFLIEKRLGPTFNPLMIIYLCSLIRKNKIDLVVTNIDKEIGIGGIAARLCGIPNIRRIGREDDFNSRLRTRFTHKLLVRNCIVPCTNITDQLISNYSWLNRDQFTTIYNGRNLLEADQGKIERQKSEWGILKGEKMIGITCQLTGVKNVHHLIEAYKNISAKYPQWKLVISGEGPESERLKKLAREYALENKIIFPGFTSDPIFTASCYDIAVSTSEFEGFPNTVVEYFAAKKPVVSTDVGGVKEIMEDGVNGFVVPFGEIETLEKRITDLISDPQLMLTFSNKTAETLQNNFTEDIMIDRLEQYFKDQLKERNV